MAAAVATPPEIQKSPSFLKEVPQGKADPILGVAQAFRESTAPNKVNLVIGAYRDEEGNPWVLPSVRTAEARILERGEKKEYAGIAGIPAFVDRALEFAYGKDNAVLLEKRVAAVQTLSGTGACRIAAEFYSRFLPKGTVAYVSDPTWPNHIPIFQQAGFEVRKYRYLDRKTNRLDFDGMLADIAASPEGSIFVMHACAHNPTGVDPTPEQWKKISEALTARDAKVLVDMAYQGFASGDAEADNAALRLLVADGHPLLLAQSFAKNFGLYGERVGALSVVCEDAAEAARVSSQLKLIIRPMYSSPPIHGALLVAEVLNDPELSAQYYKECESMAARIKKMRTLLREKIEAEQSPHDWSHITDQIGMFAYTGMSPETVEELTRDHAVFLTADGRISMAGINESNVAYVASAVNKVTSKRKLGEH
uniref:Aspartate aminotransferase n=1 Tax=Chrysotila carterae TaxID=13221 RepID=A0A7S4F4W7_CHRCT